MLPAFPDPCVSSDIDDGAIIGHTLSLTKREYFAALALPQALYLRCGDIKGATQLAVVVADELLNELAK